jgi:hypothetical protein
MIAELTIFNYICIMSLLEKYNIKEEDLYKISCLQSKIKSSGFFEREKMKSRRMAIIKPYGVRFMDLGHLFDELKELKLHEDKFLVDKYGSLDVNNLSQKWLSFPLLLKYISVYSGLMVIFCYWFDWSLAEKLNPKFQTFMGMPVWSGYVVFIFCFFLGLKKRESFLALALYSSIFYGVICSTMAAGSDAGSIGEGMSRVFFQHTKNYAPYYWNYFFLFCYAFFALLANHNMKKELNDK